MGLAAGCGLVSGGTKIVNQKLRIKVNKHDQIRFVAKAKLNSITNIVSKALTDGEISHDEFQLVINEVKKYNELKEEIRSEIRKKHLQFDAKTKQKLLEIGRKEERKAIYNKLENI